jgi:hypothetical protein
VLLKPKVTTVVVLALVLSVAVTAAGSSAATGGSLVASGRAPEIVAPTIEGGTFRLSALRGNVVVLDFLVKRVAVVRDKGFRIGRAYAVVSLGTTFVVGRNGAVAWKGSWHDSMAALSTAVSAAL